MARDDSRASSNTAAPSVMIVAAEASSGLFAQRLLEHWRKEERVYIPFGVGTDAMESLGFERLGKAEEMAVVGAVEIFEHFGYLRTVFHRLIEEAQRRRPRLVILMDYPEFNLMLAKRLHALNIPVVYYVSPQIWAWRKGRVETMKKYCRKVLLLFPFEVDFYQSKGVPCEFVGHPILDELDEKYFSSNYARQHRERYGVQPDEFVIGLMPGSRRGEVRQHLEIQLETARLLSRRFEKARFMLMVAPTLTKEYFQDLLEDSRLPIMVVRDEPFEMIHLADYVLAASGTATLMVALLEKPMVIMYRMKWLTGIIAKLAVRGVKYFGLANLIAGREIVPERFQAGANPKELSDLLARYVTEPEHTERVRSDLKKIRTALGERGATERVAHALREFLE